VRLLRACKHCDGKFRTPDVGNTILRKRDFSLGIVIRLDDRGILVHILAEARDIFLQH
jgi:hypothetical protein